MNGWIRAAVLMVISILPSLARAAEAPALAEYIAAALRNNPSRVVSETLVKNAEADRLQAVSAILPTVQGTATWTHNQYETVRIDFGAGPVVLFAQEQRDAVLAARVPLFDGPGFAKWRAARTGTRAAVEDDRAAERDLALLVGRSYYAAIASQELVRAAERSKSAADANSKYVATRAAAGAATDLAAKRADLEVARAEQLLIDAQRSWGTARRTLATLSGLPEPEVLPVAKLNLEAPPPEGELLAAAAGKRPELAAAGHRVAQLRLVRQGSWLAYAPTVSGTGTERYTNASGFSGKETSWAVGVTLDWQLFDYGTRAADVKRGRAALVKAEAELKQTRDLVADEIHSAYLDLEAARAKVAAAGRGAEVGLSAANETTTRFRAGTATQLDVTQAERDALSAEVDRIRAEGELAIARLALQRAMGEDLRP